MTYEVQTFTICDGWVNCWTYHGDDGRGYLETFDTQPAAQAALDEHLDEIAEEIELGIRQASEGYSREDFRIVKVRP